MTTITNELAKTAKAFAAGLAAFIGAVEMVLSMQPVDHQGVQFISQLQWGIVVLSVLAAYGITWRVPNRAGSLPGEVVGNQVDPNTVAVPSPASEVTVTPSSGAHAALPTEGARKGA